MAETRLVEAHERAHALARHVHERERLGEQHALAAQAPLAHRGLPLQLVYACAPHRSLSLLAASGMQCLWPRLPSELNAVQLLQGVDDTYALPLG